MSSRGKFVVFEGMDGSGKSTIARLFTKYLSETQGNLSVYPTAEPSDNHYMGSIIRKALAGQIHLDKWEMALAFAMNRASHCKTLREALEDAGMTVICDRYLMSSYVYQVRDEITFEDIKTINQTALKPDITFLLDVTPDVVVQRLNRRGGARELFERDFVSTRTRYMSVASRLIVQDRQEIYVVDANADEQTVLERVIHIWKTHDRKV